MTSNNEKPGEHEGLPEAGPGLGGQRQPEGLTHLGEWTVEGCPDAREGRCNYAVTGRLQAAP